MLNTRTQFLLLAASLLAMAPSVTTGQGLLDKAKDAARKTSVGKQVRKLGAEAQMIDATTVQLDSRNLATVAIGTLKLGISAVDVKNGVAVRLKLYLFNPASQNAVVPMPPGDLFVLIDDRGRKLQPVAEPQVKGLVAGSTDITVPGLERVEIFLLFESVAADARTGNLKVGSAGIISGIPLNTSAAPTSADGASPSPWKQ